VNRGLDRQEGLAVRDKGKAVTLDEIIAALQVQRSIDGGGVPVTVTGEIAEIVEDWAPEPVPETVAFDYYLHETSDEDTVEFISKATGIPEDHPCFENIGRPFYEVKLLCELNTKTGDVTIKGVDA
jgi:hypothetical protein